MIFPKTNIRTSILKPQSKTAVFTIVSLNYGAFAKTLMTSLLETHPDWDRFVGLADRCDDLPEFEQSLFDTVLLESLPLPDIHAFLFRYGIMELNTAIKPYMFSYLRKQGYEHIIYIDPDILVLDRLIDVENLLNEGAAAVVTPHLTAPLNDRYCPTELDIMRAGAFNLGFLAVGNQIESDAFIQWWEEKLEHGAVSDPSKGLFTDQKWVDLAPGMFGKFAILRDPGYNVAYWNLAHRSVRKTGDSFKVNNQTLRFFHFSGFDPINPKPFSKHQDRYNLETIGDAKSLALIYADKVKKNGLIESRKCAYSFGKFNDGTPIPNALRYLYREDEDIRFQAGENPFDSADFFIHGDADGLPVILRAIWLEHKHLQKAFPHPLGASRLAFYHWFVENGAVEIGIPEVFVNSIRSALEESTASHQSNAIHADYKPSIWARGLVFLHKKATNGRISPARMSQYQQISNPIDFIRLGFTQFRASRWAAKMGLGQNTSAKIDPLQTNPVNSESMETKIKFRIHSSEQKFSGIYFEAGKDAWWMGKQARFKLTETHSKKLRLRGIHHPELCKLSAGTNEMILNIGFDRMPKQEICLTENDINVDIDLVDLPTTWPATLYITPSIHFKPASLGINDDTRELSIQISELKIGEHVLFNPSSFEKDEVTSTEMLGVNLIGYARSEHGVGQSLRQFAHAVSAAKAPFTVIDFNRNNLSRTQDESLSRQMSTDVMHEINVFHINADQMPEAEMQLPSHFFGRYNIGFWHWELPEMLAEHRAGFNQLNEVWVPTGFVQEAIARHSPVPVIRMPHAISFSVSDDTNRAKFGLPENTFLFLMMYDFSSYQERKNPQAALDAFTFAFAENNEKVKLVIKTQNAHHHPQDMALLKEKLSGRSDIIWINETLSRQEVYDLQSMCDALISLHRSEGYGLGPAEAMFLGKPVIATNWSGNTEFMRQDNSLPVNYKLIQIQKDVGVYKAGQTWAEPDVYHAADLMRRLVADPDLYEKISIAARNTMRDEFSPEIIGERIQQRLRFIQENMI